MTTTNPVTTNPVTTNPVTTTTNPVTTTTNPVTTIYKAPSYKSATLQGKKDWTMPTDKFSVAKLAVEIMGYRRQYKSKGIANFCENWLEPVLNKIVAHLQSNGFVVASREEGTVKGYKNYCYDVSKQDHVGDVLFVAHYDTVDNDNASMPIYDPQTGAYKQVSQQQRLYKNVSVVDGIASLNMQDVTNAGAGCLGADDGAGLAVMLHLMHSGVVGGYCFTTGEECGGIGAGAVLRTYPTYLKQYKASIEIDRRGSSEIIISQGVGDCASQDFGDWLCTSLDMGHSTSLFGSYTDVATFAELIPENVNISAGYINAHSTNEQVDLDYLERLAEKLKLVDWTKKPIKRIAGDFGDALPLGSGTKYGYTPSKAYKKHKKLQYKAYLDELEEVAKIALQDPGFLEHLLIQGADGIDDLDDASMSYYGLDWESAKDMFKNPMSWASL